MSRSNSRPTDLPLLPALYVGLLAFGAAVHHNPTLLSPMLGLVHALTLALVP